MASSNIRYEVLPSEEQNVPAEQVDLAMVVPPPSYTETPVMEQQDNEPAFGPAKLPNYVEATTLPSYEEAERIKLEQDENNPITDLEAGRLTTLEGLNEANIGTDSMFICTFFISFLFNWFGFLLSLCLTNTIAGRCGALSGLGLSIVKWVVIAKRNKWGTDFAEADSWLWWLLVLCGFLLFVRGSVQYVRVKYEWSRFTNQIRHLRFF